MRTASSHPRNSLGWPWQTPKVFGFLCSLRGPLLAAYPLSLWKITNTHKVTVEPSQPPTEPIWSSLKRSNYHPLCAAISLFIWTNRITVGLRRIDCDGGWEAPERWVLRPGFAEPLCCVRRVVELLSWSEQLLYFSWTVERYTYNICTTVFPAIDRGIDKYMHHLWEYIHETVQKKKNKKCVSHSTAHSHPLCWKCLWLLSKWLLLINFASK